MYILAQQLSNPGVCLTEHKAGHRQVITGLSMEWKAQGFSRYFLMFLKMTSIRSCPLTPRLLQWRYLLVCFVPLTLNTHCSSTKLCGPCTCRDLIKHF